MAFPRAMWSTSNEDAYSTSDRIQIEPFPYVLLLSIRSTHGDGVGGRVALVLLAQQPMDCWVHTISQCKRLYTWISQDGVLEAHDFNISSLAMRLHLPAWAVAAQCVC